jgi:hypothetical protein
MKQSVYRIYTERINYPEIVERVSRYFDGATFTQTTGLWQGKLEESVVIELWTQDSALVRGLACSLQTLNKQDTVAVTHHVVDLHQTDVKCCLLGACEDRTPDPPPTKQDCFDSGECSAHLAEY